MKAQMLAQGGGSNVQRVERNARENVHPQPNIFSPGCLVLVDMRANVPTDPTALSHQSTRKHMTFAQTCVSEDWFDTPQRTRRSSTAMTSLNFSD